MKQSSTHFKILNSLKKGEKFIELGHGESFKKLNTFLLNESGQLKDYDELLSELFPKFSENLDGVQYCPMDRLISEEEKKEILLVFNEVLDSGKFTSGPYHEKFSKQLTTFFQKKHAILCSSGTDALKVALLAAGVGSGDEVITVANSFAATENAIFAVGATPVFADIDPDTYNICPESIKNCLTKNTKAILPVDLYGKTCDVEGIKNICKENNLISIQDAAQSIGSDNVTQGFDLTALSFNPFKNFSAIGKAGAIITDNDDLAHKCHVYAYHGFEPGIKNKKIAKFGLNSRIDNLQAAVCVRRFPYMALNNFKRLILADRYTSKLQGLAEGGYLKASTITDDCVWHQYSIEVLKGSRDKLRKSLKDNFKVETDIYYPILSTDQPNSWAENCKKQSVESLKNTYESHGRLLHLPIYSNMSMEEQDVVIESLYKYFGV